MVVPIIHPLRMGMGAHVRDRRRWLADRRFHAGGRASVRAHGTKADGRAPVRMTASTRFDTDGRVGERL